MKHFTCRRCLVALAVVGLPLGCIRMDGDRADIMLMHIPTVLALVGSIAFAARARLTDAACVMLFAFYALHLLGAHYYYACVPYDDWARSLLGHDITATFGFSRNHYDRLVHLGFGLLLYLPAREWLGRHGLSGWRAGAGSVALLLSWSAAYEIFEWLVAVTMAPERAERYNGQQGDFFDAQKDMALAFAGSALAAGVEAAASLFRREAVTA
ncbi:MAG: hypothetical protein FD180_1141 [Planctomycetota bacterium]|nr:MAG: hypothetical protein FD180_1141 [Planctomycetota bacterium]